MLPVKSREVHNTCYPDNYAMRYCHRSVGVISQSFLNLWCLLHSGYKRYKVDIQSLYIILLYIHTQSLKYIPKERSHSNQTFGVVTIQIHAHSKTDFLNSLNEESKLQALFLRSSKKAIKATDKGSNIFVWKPVLHLVPASNSSIWNSIIAQQTASDQEMIAINMYRGSEKILQLHCKWSR